MIIMKMGINRIQKVLLLVIGVLSIVLAGLLGYKGYSKWQDKKQEEEWARRHDEVQMEIDSVRMQIQELAYDTEALQAFLDENMQQEVVVFEETSREVEEETQEEAQSETQSETQTAKQEVVSDAIVIEAVPEGDTKQEETIETENQATPEQPTETEAQMVPEQPTEIETQTETEQETGTETQTAPEQPTIAEYNGDAIIIDAPPELVIQQTSTEQTAQTAQLAELQTQPQISNVSDETISGNEMATEKTETTVESISGNGVEIDMTMENRTISGNAIVNGQVIPYVPIEKEMTLEDKRQIRSSYVETMQVNGEDKAIISRSNLDFSGMKIACIGDSITEGSNLDNLENYQQYSYPSVLKNILNATEVYNLGIGGSSYGRYWDQAFVDRYKEIPQDVNIILVMGGTNDGFAASSKELGSLEKKEPRTYYGDVDELMRGLKADYPNAKIIFITPLPNVLHDYLRNQRDYLLPQSVFANAVKELAAQHEIDVIDLYNSNILDTHDAQIISTYMPDGVHANPAGYQILAEHIASGMIQILEQDGMEKSMVSGNVAEKTVSGNDGEDSVSGNGAMAEENAIIIQ